MSFSDRLPSSAADATFQTLRQVRSVLLRLHKALLDSERVMYEKVHGPVRSQGELFRLVLEDDWFRWLRPFSQLIAEIDEAFSTRKDPITVGQATQLLNQAHALTRPIEQGTAAEQAYYQVMQRDAQVALLHADLSRLIQPQP